MDYPFPCEKLQEKLGYQFHDIRLLKTALTHSSYAHEMNSRSSENHVEYNERLEFLGDSVLSIVVSEYLFTHYTELPEGDLTKIRADVVCERALSKYSEQIGLGKYLLMGRGEDKSGGRFRRSIVADAFEAVLAAMYLDSGEDKRVISRYLMPFVLAEISDAQQGGHEKDYKTALQQLVQQPGDGAKREVLEYVTTGEIGPDHQKTFEVEARLNSNVIGKGSGRTKREAEQNAAKQALALFGEL